MFSAGALLTVDRAMNFKQLSHFVALIEHRSFVRASEACNITQPAFSRSIRGLEEALGCQLVDRQSGRNFQPTVQGERVLQHARSVLEGMSRLTRELHTGAGLEAAEIRVGCAPLAGERLVPPAIARFLGDYPRMQVRLEVAHWQGLVRGLKRDTLDFLITASEPFTLDEQYEVTPLHPQRMALVCRAGHPLLQQPGRLTAARLFSFPVALPAGARPVLGRMARVLGVQPPAVALESDTANGLLRVVASSDLIGLMQVAGFEAEMAALGVQPLDQLEEGLRPFARYAVIQRREQRLSPACERLLEYIKEADARPAAFGPALKLAN